ncbi:hypothetical protein SBADM41S_05500 [Streptomyces badius]
MLRRAEDLMADAVHAEHTFFSTCGSSLSVKAAMLSVAAPHQKLLVGRDAHKSVIAGLILSGVEPVWLEPQWDAERHLAHPPSAATVEKAFAEHPDARGALVTSPTPYGAAADLRAIADVCHRRSRPLIVDEAWARICRSIRTCRPGRWATTARSGRRRPRRRRGSRPSGSPGGCRAR